MENEDPLLVLVIYGLLGVLPWLLVGFGGWMLWSAYRFIGRAVRTRGRVLEVSRIVSESTTNGSRTVSITYKPRFEITAPDGQVVQAETAMSSDTYDFEIGSEHDILFDPLRGEVRMPGFWIYGFGVVFVAIGLVFAIVGFVVFSLI